MHGWLIHSHIHKHFTQTASVTGKPNAGDKGRLLMNYRGSAEKNRAYLTNILEIAILFAKHNTGIF